MDTRSSDLQKLEHTAIVRRFSATHPLITGALPGLAGTAETQGTAGGSWCQHSSASGKNLPAFHQLWIRLCLIGIERGLSDFYFCVTLAGLQANSRVCLDREQWIGLIHIICISDEWEESNDSFRGQLFIYSLTLSRKFEMHSVWDSALSPFHLCNLKSFQNIPFYEGEIAIQCLGFCIQLKSWGFFK